MSKEPSPLLITALVFIMVPALCIAAIWSQEHYAIYGPLPFFIVWGICLLVVWYVLREANK
jgi:hypothetical protein